MGPDDWPLPSPSFGQRPLAVDSKAGRQEILYRRIGRNELDAIRVPWVRRGPAEYAYEKHDGATLNQYAQRTSARGSKTDWPG